MFQVSTGAYLLRPFGLFPVYPLTLDSLWENENWLIYYLLFFDCLFLIISDLVENFDEASKDEAN